jgi:hypothetical protein
MDVQVNTRSELDSFISFLLFGLRSIWHVHVWRSWCCLRLVTIHQSTFLSVAYLQSHGSVLHLSFVFSSFVVCFTELRWRM